jgi:hypothetical protein
MPAVEEDLGTARTTTEQRAAFLADHTTEIRQVELITRTIADRVDRAVCRVLSDQPAYLTRTLGPLPTNGDPVGAWIDAASVIETYRLEHGIVDKQHALGREPTEPADRWVWQETARVVATVLNPSPVLEPGPPAPELGIEIEL